MIVSSGDTNLLVLPVDCHGALKYLCKMYAWTPWRLKILETCAVMELETSYSRRWTDGTFSSEHILWHGKT